MDKQAKVTQASSLDRINATQASSLDKLSSNSSLFFNPFLDVSVCRRNLPHWHQDGVMYFVTFRLADSLPRSKLEQLEGERDEWVKHHKQPYSEDEWGEYHELFSVRVENWLDAGMGCCCLAQADVAAVVGDAIRFFDKQRYTLDEWVVMPNHVHALLVLLGRFEISSILHSWKSYTATKVNAVLGSSGQSLWMHESYDHIVRSEQQLAHYRKYIRENPEKAHVAVHQASWLN